MNIDTANLSEAQAIDLFERRRPKFTDGWELDLKPHEEDALTRCLLAAQRGDVGDIEDRALVIRAVERCRQV
jgi:hypothetical protein